MANYTPRLEAPSTSNRYYFADNVFYQSGYGMPNCTAYAWGRFYEITGTYPKLSTRDAEKWYGNTADGYSRGQTPKLGAVICWRKGSASTDSDGSGHVAVVEQINSDGSIVTSESGWNSDFWWTKTRTKGDGNWGAGSAYTFQGFIYSPINFDNDPEPEPEPDPDDYVVYDPKKVWDFLMEKIGNEYGVAGMMANLEAESGLYSDRKQGDIPYSSKSKIYTGQVNTGTMSEYTFVHDSVGYGLAQWTYSSRKQGLYNMWKSGGYNSIGNLDLALDYLWLELTRDFPGVLSVLKNASSIREASDKVLHDFENPADQSSSVELKRESMGQAWYNKYHGSEPGEPEDPGTEPEDPRPGWSGHRKKMSLILMITASQRGDR